MTSNESFFTKITITTESRVHTFNDEHSGGVNGVMRRACRARVDARVLVLGVEHVQGSGGAGSALRRNGEV